MVPSSSRQTVEAVAAVVDEAYVPVAAARAVVDVAKLAAAVVAEEVVAAELAVWVYAVEQLGYHWDYAVVVVVVDFAAAVVFSGHCHFCCRCYPADLSRMSFGSGLRPSLGVPASFARRCSSFVDNLEP